MSSLKERLTDILINNKLITHQQLEEALKLQQSSTKASQKDQVEQVIKDYDRKIEAAGYDDFYEKVSILTENQILGPNAYEAIMSVDNGPAIEMHLASNLDLAERIGRMSPGIQAAEIGRLSVNSQRQRVKK